MTLRELREALDGLPQLSSDTQVTAEDYRGVLREVISVESEPEYGIVVIKLGTEVDV